MAYHLSGLDSWQRKIMESELFDFIERNDEIQISLIKLEHQGAQFLLGLQGKINNARFAIREEGADFQAVVLKVMQRLLFRMKQREGAQAWAM